MRHFAEHSYWGNVYGLYHSCDFEIMEANRKNKQWQLFACHCLSVKIPSNRNIGFLEFCCFFSSVILIHNTKNLAAAIYTVVSKQWDRLIPRIQRDQTIPAEFFDIRMHSFCKCHFQCEVELVHIAASIVRVAFVRSRERYVLFSIRTAYFEQYHISHKSILRYCRTRIVRWHLAWIPSNIRKNDKYSNHDPIEKKGICAII